MNYLSKDGLIYFWSLLKAKFNAKQDNMSAGTGISFSGTTINHSNSVTAATNVGGNSAVSPSLGTAFNVPYFSYDAQGHVTGSGTHTVTIVKPTTISGYGITDAYTKTEIDGKLTSAMHYKGSVATYADLPSTGNEVGDMYNVTATGANYAWTGTAWDETGMIVDLSPYALNSSLVAITNSEIDTVVAS